MGLFDYVKFRMPCPNCGKTVGGFQSKDGMCALAELEFWEVDNFYTNCGECDVWIEFTRPREKCDISKYKMKWRKPTWKNK